MTVDQAVLNTYLFATGKATPPASGTTKYTKILALLNVFTQNWASEIGINWKSLRQPGGFTLTTVTATDTFALPVTIGALSNQEGDFVRIYHTDGVHESDYTIVPIERLYDDGPTLNNWGANTANGIGTCAVVGANLVFPRAFISTDPQFGGTIKAQGYIIPPTLTTGSNTIAVDDPFWVCYMSAAEYVRNDITRVQQYGNLVALANNSMAGMKEANQSQLETVYTGGWSPLGNTWD